MSGRSYDAAVIGSGPNGLAAAVALAQAGRAVVLFEAEDEVGGGTRTRELTLPGFRHDVCSGIHPMAVASPFLCSLPLHEHGLTWIHSDAPLAHPFDDGEAVVLERDPRRTAEQLGPDRERYARWIAPTLQDWDALVEDGMGPLRIPSHPFAMARFGLRALRSAAGLARASFEGPRARALFAGLAGHSLLPLERPGSAAIGLMLGTAAHAVGWPMPAGGAQSIARALASLLRSLGGEIVTGVRIRSLRELPGRGPLLFDVSPSELLRIAGPALSSLDRTRLARYRHGPGVFKLDWALSQPIPWKAEACRRAATVHLGGSLEQIAAGERAAWAGQVHERPFVLLAQHTLFDSSRAPSGQHTGWAYCHVPARSTHDYTEIIEAQVERFAPGFRDTILARHAMGPADFEHMNPNYVGGDINNGVADLGQLFTRPWVRAVPYRTSNPRILLCSAATPPGPGVHGLAGYFAARAALGSS